MHGSPKVNLLIVERRGRIEYANDGWKASRRKFPQLTFAAANGRPQPLSGCDPSGFDDSSASPLDDLLVVVVRGEFLDLDDATFAGNADCVIGPALSGGEGYSNSPPLDPGSIEPIFNEP